MCYSILIVRAGQPPESVQRLTDGVAPSVVTLGSQAYHSIPVSHKNVTTTVMKNFNSSLFLQFGQFSYSLHSVFEILTQSALAKKKF